MWSLLWHCWLKDRNGIQSVKTTCLRVFSCRTGGGREPRRNWLSHVHLGNHGGTGWASSPGKTWRNRLTQVHLGNLGGTGWAMFTWKTMEEPAEPGSPGKPRRNRLSQVHRDTHTHTHTHTQPFCGPFSGTTRVSRCQKRTSGLYGARED